MTTFRLLIVEDDPQDRNTCRNTVLRYEHERSRTVELTECVDLADAFYKLNRSFDGAIIDLKLGNDQDAGNEVVRKIEEQQLRIPVAILTATPDNVDSSFTHIGVFKKGEPEAGYFELLDRFWSIHDTGLTRILGGRGLIESKLGQIFRQNILPQVSQWEEYGRSDPEKTENALLRHTVNHLIQLIDEDTDLYFPEEFYLHPPLTRDLRTGSVLATKDGDGLAVVMSPDCDLVVREGGKRNTDTILVVEVVSVKDYFAWQDVEDLQTLSNSKRNRLNSAKTRGYLHLLPQTEFFQLSFLNFRSLSSIKIKDLDARFRMPPDMQISPPFVKDIVARFSTYYARQGQPGIDHGTLL